VNITGATPIARLAEHRLYRFATHIIAKNPAVPPNKISNQNNAGD